MQDNATIAAQVPDMHSRRVTAEVAGAVEPHAVYWDHMWGTVPAYCGDPVMPRLRQPLLNRCPVQEAVGRTITGRKFELLSNRRHGSSETASTVPVKPARSFGRIGFG